MLRYLYLWSNIVAVQLILFYMTVKVNLLYSIQAYEYFNLSIPISISSL